jgi:hypothetical protein
MEEDKTNRKHSEEIIEENKLNENDQPEKKLSEQKVF